MKIPEPIKLPSGKYRIQIMVDGKRVGNTFDTPEEARFWASGIKTKMVEAQKPVRKLTVGEAADRYIESRSEVLSPSTIAGYKRIRKNLMKDIENIVLADLTQERVQRWVNRLSREGKTPKTIANAHGFLSPILAEYKPEMALRTTMPQKVKTEIEIPSEADAVAIANACKGTKYELPIMIAIWLGLRASEIIGLRWDDIDGEYLQIRRAIVAGENGPVEKGVKTYSGTRRIHLPSYLLDLIQEQPRANEHIVNLSGHALYSGFVRICEKAKVRHYRFHDLRHFNASVMLAEGIPDKYGIKRMGHATNNMLKTTYQHTLAEKEKAFDKIIDGHFEELFAPKE